jgi:NTE family protein
MIAFILSGGGSRGAFEVEALRALICRGIQPDILVGSSAGAVNATGLALDPTLEGVDRLEKLWLDMDEDDFYSANPLVAAFRLMLNRPSLYSNRRFYRLVRSEVLPQARSFSDLNGVRLYLTGVDLDSGKLHIFGDDPADSLVDAIMASTAIQPYFAPWRYRGRDFIDGGLVSNLPVLAALERGATEVYAIDVTLSSAGADEEEGLLSILKREAFLVIDQLRRQELIKARARLGNKLHHIHYAGYAGLMPFEFTNTIDMIADGEAIMSAYLDRSHPDRFLERFQGWLGRGRQAHAGGRTPVIMKSQGQELI